MRVQDWHPDDRRVWSLAATVALVAHIGGAALVLLWARPAVPPVPEPVVLVELPPQAAPAAAVSTQRQVAQPQPEHVLSQPITPPIAIPPARAPLPKDAVTLPQSLPPAPPRSPSAVSAATMPTSPIMTSPTGAGAGTNATPGSDPRAKRAEVDYFALISAHLNRRKTYPTEAKKARQEGVVTVRFTVDRSGAVSNISIRRSSGHDILDTATLQLLERVAPLPRMPTAMQRDSVTLALPIDYSLRTN